MKPTILAIDDDQPILWLIAQILKDFEVVCKSDGLEAMLWLSKGNHPDLIILDREMPNLGGVKFLRALRGSGIYKDIPVMFLSSAIDNKFQKDLNSLNVKMFLEKPFDPTYLVDLVKSQLYAKEVIN
jgi:CheY-like chemotaxis protein